MYKQGFLQILNSLTFLWKGLLGHGCGRRDFSFQIDSLAGAIFSGYANKNEKETGKPATAEWLVWTITKAEMRPKDDKCVSLAHSISQSLTWTIFPI